jgi:hypothetical protein
MEILGIDSILYMFIAIFVVAAIVQVMIVIINPDDFEHVVMALSSKMRGFHRKDHRAGK